MIFNSPAMEPGRLLGIDQTDACERCLVAQAKTLDDFLNYYRALGKVTKRPVFVQTSGGAQGIEPKVEALVELAREFPNVAYVKEEYPPVIDRMIALAIREGNVRIR